MLLVEILAVHTCRRHIDIDRFPTAAQREEIEELEPLELDGLLEEALRLRSEGQEQAPQLVQLQLWQ